MKCLKLLVFIFALSKLSRRYYFANNYIVYRNCTFGRIKLSFINFTITSLRNLFDHLIFITRKKIKSRFFFHLQKIYSCHWLAPRFLGHHICSAITSVIIQEIQTLALPTPDLAPQISIWYSFDKFILTLSIQIQP